MNSRTNRAFCAAFLFASACASFVAFCEMAPASARPPVSVRKVSLTAAERRKLNTFFSNFSEAHVQPFARGKISENDLIEFGIWHNEMNNSKLSVKVKGFPAYYAGLSARYVEASAWKFFGRKITRHHSPSKDHLYENGYYGYPLADGEGFQFSQVTQFYNLGGSEYRAGILVYNVGGGWEGDPQGTPATWRHDGNDYVPELKRRIRATVRRVTENGASRYILLEYRELK